MAERGQGTSGGARVAAPCAPHRKVTPLAAAYRAAVLLRGTAVRAGLLCSTALLPIAGPAQAQVAPNARPTGGAVVAGSAGIAQGAAQTTVTQTSQRAALEWQQFNVGSQHSVQFVQPNAQAATLNRVVGPDPSVIAGRIRANTPDGGAGGMVAIVNQSGVVFANGSQVSVGSLIASASNITNQNFMAGRMVFDGPARPGARVENHGTITVADRGLAALVGPRVTNTGLIQGRLARVALQGGAEAYSLDLAGDGMLAIDVTQAVRGSTNGVALATNSGVIEAPGGNVLISAHAASGLVEDLVRNTGRVSANTADGRTGQVALRANGGNVRIEGTVEARGAAPGQAGGRIQAEAVGGAVTVAAGARVSASGDAAGGQVQIGGRTTREARVEGRVTARSRAGRGGQVAVQAAEAVTLAAGASVDVSGATGGGTALIGTEGIGRAQVMAARTTIAAGATVRADATGNGNGGTIAVNSATMTEVRGTLSARAGTAGGDGGFVEVSTLGGIVFPDMLAQVDVAAPAGQAGTLLLDPNTINIGNGGSAVGGSVAAGDSPTTLNITAASVGTFSGNLVLEALHRINVDQQVNRTGGSLTLSVTGASAGGDGIVVAAGAGIAVTGGNRFLTLTSANGGTAAGTITVAGALSTAGANADLTIRAASVSTSGAGTLSAGRNLEVTATGAAGIALGAGASAAASGTATLTADAIAVTAGTVTAGTVILAASTADTAVSLGGAAAAGQLTLGSATLTAIDTPVLAIRATGTGGVRVDAPVDRGTRTLDLEGAAVTQASAAPITAGALRAVATTGAVSLVAAPATPNLIGVVAGRGETGFAISNGQALEIGTVRGSTGVGASGPATINLQVATGDLTQTAPITGNVRLRAVADAGNVALGLTGNEVRRAAGAATGSFALTSNQALEISTVAGSSGILLGAGGRLDLRATQGDLTSPVALVATELRATADAGSVRLASVSNTVGTVAGTAGDVFEFLNSPALKVGTVLGTAGITAGAGGVSLAADGGIEILAGAPVTAASGATIALRADTMTIGARVAAPAGTISLATNTAGTGAVLGGAGAGAGLVIDSAELALLGGSGTTGSDVPAARLQVTASGGIALADGVALRGRFGTLSLETTGGVTQPGNGLDVGRLVAQAGAGVEVANAAASNRIDEVAVALTGAGGVSVRSMDAARLTVVADADSGIAGIGGTVTPTTVTLAGAALALDAAVAGGTVTLAATGAITQGASGTVTAATLLVQGPGGAGTAAGSVRLDQAGNAIDSLGAVRANGDVVLRSDGASFGMAATVRSETGNVTLQNGRTDGILALTGGEAQAPTGTVALIADAFDFGAAGVRARGRTVAIGPTSARDVLVDGAAVPGALVLDAAVFARLAPTTRLTLGGGGTRDVVFRAARDFTVIAPELGVLAGRSVTQTASGLVAGRLQVDAGGNDATGSVTLDLAGPPGNVVTQFGATTGASGTVAFRAGGFEVTGIDAGGTIGLTATAGSITQTGAISGGVLTARADAVGGSVVLDSVTNAVAGVTGSANQVFALRNGAGLAVAGASGSTVRLRANTLDITQSAAIVAGTLVATADSGGVALAGLANSVGTVGGTAGTSFDFRNGGSVLVSGIGAGTTVGLTADTGSITQSGTISGTALTATATGGSVNLGTQANALSSVGGTAGTSFAYRDTNGFDVTGITAGTTVGLTADTGGITQSGAISGTALSVTATGGSIDLGTQANALSSVGGTAGTSFAYRDTNGFAVAGIGAGTTVGLTADTGGITQSGTISGTVLTATATGGSVVLDSLTNAVTGIGGTSGGSFGFRNGAGFAVAGIGAGTTVGLTADTGSITQTGAISGTALSVTATGGSIDLGTHANAFTSVGGTAGTSFAYRDTNGFAVAGIGAGTTVGLTADTGSITQTGAISGTALSVTATGGSIDLGTAANALSSVGGTAGTSFAYRDTNGFAVAGISAGTTVGLTADTGGITQTGTISGTVLTATATGGSVVLDSLANAVTGIGGTAGGSFGFRNGTGFAVTGIGAGTTVGLTADTGGITQSGAISGTALTVTATGGSIDLGTHANAFTSVGGTAGTSFAYRDTNGFDVTGIGAGTTVGLTADTGGITQSGAISGTVLSVTATGGSVNLGTQANALTSVGGTVGGSFAYRDANGFDVTGITAGTTVGLTADTGSITQSGAISGTALTATATGGSVDLGTQANALASVGGTAGTGFAYRDTNGFDVTGIGAGTTVGLTADTGSITQSGAISGTVLSVTATGGSVNLGTQANALASIGGTTGSSFAYRDTNGFDVTGITAGTTVGLTADTGSITQSGVISGTLLTATATGGSVDLASQANALAGVGGTAGTSFAYRDINGFDVTGIGAGTTVGLTAGTGGITQSGAIQGTTLTVTATGGPVDLGTRANRLAGVGITAGGAVSYRDADSVDITGIAAGGTVTLGSDGGGITQSGSISGTALRATAPGGAVVLDSLANSLTSAGGTAGAGFGFRNAAGFDVTGITAGTAIGLTADTGGITQSAPISGASLLVTAPGGPVALDTQANTLLRVGGSTAGSFAYRDADGFAVTGIAAGTTVSLTADTGGITQSGIISGTALTVTATGGSVDLGTQPNALAQVGGTASGSFAYRDADGFVVTGIGAGTTVSLTADTGSITQTGVISGTALTATAPGGSVALDTQANMLARVGGSAGSGFAWRDADGFEVTGIAAGTTVALTAETGAITQSGIISGTRLSVSAPGGSVVLDSQPNAVAQVGGTAGTSLAYRDADGFDVTGITAGTTIGLTAMTGSITQSGILSGAALTASAPGGAVTLDTLANSLGSVGGAAGTRFGWRDADSFVVSGITAGTAAALTADTGGITQTGAIQAPVLTVAAPGGAVDLSTAANRVTGMGGSVAGSLAFRDADGVDVTGITAGTTVTLAADAGSITQSAAISGTALDARAPGGDVTLLADNHLVSAGGLAGGRFDFRNVGSFNVDGITAGTVVGLTSVTGGITQTGPIRGTRLEVSAATPGQSILLDGAPNRIVQLEADTDQTFAFRSEGPLTVAGIRTGTAGTVDLRAETGNIGQTGAIATGSLRARADAGAVDLTGASNRVTTVSGRGSTGFALRNGQALTIGTVLGTAGIEAPLVDLQVTAGNLGQTAAIATPLLRVRADTGSVLLTGGNRVGTLAGSAAGDIRFNNDQSLAIGAVAGTAGLTSTGSGATTIALTTAGDLGILAGNVTALGANALVSLTAAGGIGQTGGIIATRRLALQAGQGIALGNPNQFETLTGAGFGAQGGVLRGLAYTVTGAVEGTGGVTLLAAGSLAIGGPGLGPGVTSGAGGLTIASDVGPVSIGPSAIRAFGGPLAVTGPAGVTMTDTSLLAAGPILLAAPNGPMTLSGVGASSGGAFSATAAGPVALSGTSVSASGPLGVASLGSLSVAGSSLVSASPAPLDGVTLAALGGASITGSQITAATRVTVQAGGTLFVNPSAISADTALLAGQTALLVSLSATIGRDIIIAAPGGITNVAPLQVTPRVPGQYPAVIYDTRAAPPQSANAILAYVQPDQPGLQPDQQPTQLRSAPGAESADPFFGASSSAAAGPIAMNVQAGSSPVFLLIDGGTATGTLTAGRLLVHGTGGKVELQGTLSGLSGAEATRASDITRPVTPESLPDYRINSCVIGSINCVVTPRFQPIPPSVRTNVEFTFRQNAFNPADVIIPNTGENDYE